jgi:hypothetical protein
MSMLMTGGAVGPETIRYTRPAIVAVVNLPQVQGSKSL